MQVDIRSNKTYRQTFCVAFSSLILAGRAYAGTNIVSFTNCDPFSTNFRMKSAVSKRISINTLLLACLLIISFSNVSSRTSFLTKISNGFIRAAKLYDLIVKSSRSIVKCSAYCVAHSLCIYITLDEVTMTCTLYTTGIINYDVNNLQTFSVRFKSEVIF